MPRSGRKSSRRSSRSGGGEGFARPARRRLSVEPLEGRNLLTALPFGAMPDDTGEYMLGDVRVTVVLMESDGTRDVSTQDWTADTINTIKSNVAAGLNWWQETLDALPTVRDGLLNFTVDWTHADTPVATGYEPIARVSNDFSLWIYDFLNKVGFNQTGNFSSDIRAFNNFQRQQVGADWAFTIFVVNDNAEPEGQKGFADGGSFKQAFAFAGGRFMVVPANRPVSSYAHETGHMFWAFDEYNGTTANYLSRRGYYNTQNLNHAANPTPGFVQQPSIMGNDDPLSNPPVLTLTNAFNSHTSAVSTLEMIGWKDSDGDGIFDVLDVPFDMTGIGKYDNTTGLYRFTGSVQVGTLPNQNPSGLKSDISINQIRAIEVSIDGGPWTTVLTLPPRTYQTNIDVSFAVPGGQHTVKLRASDTRTGASSAEFSGNTLTPTSTGAPGISGFVFRDDDGDAVWDANEPPLTDFGLEIVDQDDNPIDLMRNVEPSVYPQSTVLNTIHPEATITAIGGDVLTNEVKALTSGIVPAAGRVFTARSILTGQAVETWTGTSRQLRVDFASPVSVVSLRAYSGGGTSFGRLEAYNAQGVLLERFTTNEGISGSAFKELTINRPAADVAYVVAYGHAGTSIVLDTLQWGAKTSATSNIVGAYSLLSLPAGTYRVKADPPPNHIVTTPTGGVATITVAPGEAVTSVNFGIRIQASLWHNVSSPLNVNNDPQNNISPIDALLVINWLNSHPNQQVLPADGDPLADGFIDVNNDGFASPLDALLVINRLNSNPPAGGGGGESEGETPPARAAEGGGRGEGEETPIPRSAAEYYAQNPIHLMDIPGTDLPCCCSACVARIVESSSSGAAANSPLAPPDAAGLSALATIESPRLATRPAARAGALPHPSRAAAGRLESRLLPVVKQETKHESSPLAAKKSKLDQALDAIAADVAQGSSTEPAPADRTAFRRPRTRG